MEFEWDDGKAQSNLAKHGVSFDDAASIFGDPLAVTWHDPDHSEEEDRFLTIGSSERGKLLIVAHTDRGDRIRIINARPTTTAERKGYENGHYPPPG